MDGLKYSNVGDIVVINPNDYVNYWGYNMLKNGHAGLLDTEWITTIAYVKKDTGDNRLALSDSLP